MGIFHLYVQSLTVTMKLHSQKLTWKESIRNLSRLESEESLYFLHQAITVLVVVRSQKAITYTTPCTHHHLPLSLRWGEPFLTMPLKSQGKTLTSFLVGDFQMFLTVQNIRMKPWPNSSPLLEIISQTVIITMQVVADSLIWPPFLTTTGLLLTKYQLLTSQEPPVLLLFGLE